GKQYHRNYYALKNVSFDVEKGEIVGIVGKNGSGKSTILKILTGVLNQTEGDIEINGKVAALLELGAGFNMEYTGMKNIYLNAAMMRVSKEEIEKKIPDILAFADIGDFIHQPVKTYSSGMFVRLAFSVAINVDPDILIVDEALAVGDQRFQLKCMDKFMEFVERGKTILFVTHDVNSVKRFCNRAVWLNQGELIMDGNTDEVTDRYVDFLNSDLTIEKYLELCSNIRSDEDVKESDEVDNNEIDTKNIDIVQIHDLRMYDSKGREIENIIHGEKVTLKASYIVNDDTIETPLLGVAIRRIDNEYICGLNTKLDNLTIPWKKGYNEITLTYPDFNLVGGEYYFDVGIFDKTGIVNIDYKAKIRSFFVKMDYIAEGVVVLNHSWNVE
ncbi:MAG: ABC transporter ATP-binding protein, partial [Oscillospiraceae bacterium]|nr:ABC transporter ATP-binding protein [Oscillospiraceae bacterium]